MALAPHSQSSCSRWLVVDTDAGVDDAFALCMALKLAKKNNLEFKLITCCFGNCTLQQVGINVAKCLAACTPCARPAIVLGAAGPLSTEKAVHATHFHGSDGLGDATEALSEELTNDLLGGDNDGGSAAAKALLELLYSAKKEGAEVTLVTLGPLTNLALALQADPELPLLLNELVVMGCCGNGRGNHGRVTEFNIHADPEAASEVFARSWTQLTVSSWDLTIFATVPWQYFDLLINEKTAKTEVGKFLGKISHLPYVQKRSTSSCSRGSDCSLTTFATTRIGSGEGGCCLSIALMLLHCLEPILKHLQPQQGVGLWHLSSIPGAIICDAITLAMVLRPEMILRSSHVHIEVELLGAITRGQTVVDWGTCFDGMHRPKHLRWVEEVDMNLFCRLLRDTVS